ncbi:tetratricopeptide repeat protein [Dokdonia ponticola]|uniref:Tetratricopeptide repeat protein n=1 Tax=Dokdonia ponticola TaxID=2041041 RepID=A0ABV9HUF0_9FLAO
MMTSSPFLKPITAYMRHVFSLFFLGAFLLCSTTVFSQKKVIDSLENALIINKTKDTIRVNNLDRLSYLYYRTDIDKAKSYIEKAEALSNELDFGKGIGNATYMRGIIATTQSEFELAINYYETAAQIYRDNDVKKNIAGCYNGIGVIYLYQGDYDKSSTYFQKAIEADKIVGLERNIPSYITNIGINQLNLGKNVEALESFKKSLQLFTEANHEQGIATNLKNIALIYKRQGNYPLALEYNNNAIALAEKMQDSFGLSNSLNNTSLIYKAREDYDNALVMLERSLTIYEKIGSKKGISATKHNIGSIYLKKNENEIGIKYILEALHINREFGIIPQIAECLNSLGDANVTLKNYSNAIAYFQEAKNINIDIGNQDGISLSYLGIAECYAEQKKYKEALPNAIKSLEISNELDLMEYQKDAHRLLSEIYFETKNYKKAYTNHIFFKKLSDSLFNKENIEKLTQIEYEYKYKKALDSASMRELSLTKTVKATSQNLEKSQRNYLRSIIGFLLISMLLGGIIFYLKYRNIKAATHNIIVEQRLLRSQMTPHFIFNSLSVLQGMILNKEEKKSVVYLSKFSKLLRIILENSREKMVLLSQELAAIENYLSLQNLENESYNYTVSIEETIDTNAFEIPPMLIQPFVENAIEHAFTNQLENREIHVRITYEDQKLICTITDNGVGIHSQPIAKRKDKNSLATTITSERLQILSKDFNREGSVTIENRQKYNEQGTLVTLIIPYVKGTFKAAS